MPALDDRVVRDGPAAPVRRENGPPGDSRPVRWLVFLAIVLLAAALRFPSLAARPMHTDEAVQAAKLGRLLEEGRYEYDPREFHGPTLNYLTLVSAALRGEARYVDLDEVTLRAVPATMGVLLVAAHALLVPVVGFPAAAAAALLAAVSPAMVFYNRYYIHETPLVFFSFGALISMCRYLQAPRTGWALGAGTCIGLMYATKETWVIPLGAMALGLACQACLPRRVGRGRAESSGRSPVWDGPSLRPGSAGGRTRRQSPVCRWRVVRDASVAAVAAAVVSSALFTSFFSHPGGLLDSFGAYGTYMGRAGAPSWHTHPPHYYLGLLLYSHVDGAPRWTEGVILALALGGAVLAWRRGAAGIFLAAYAASLAVAYAVIPYKTPWCLLGFLHAFILLAGVATASLLGAARTRTLPRFATALVAAALVHLGWQAWSASFRFPADPRNPYVYAHTSTDVFGIAARVERLAFAHPLRYAMPIDIISGQNLWPLPWYLRRFSAVRWQSAPSPGAGNAPVILATPDMEGAVVRKVYEWQPPGERELYVGIFDGPMELRPAVEVRGYAAKSLWDACDAGSRPAGD